jgi:rRNA maturation RNase YbeY
MSFQVETYIEPHYPVKKHTLTDAAIRALEKANVKAEVQVAISVIGDRKMRHINKEFRDKDEPTDVLAFPYSLETGNPRVFLEPPTKYLNLGDVIISYPQALERAAKEDTLIDDMIAFLTIHGVLHLLGYDHEKEAEAATMEDLEDQIFSSIQV